jgi:hypothetical protein
MKYCQARIKYVQYKSSCVLIQNICSHNLLLFKVYRLLKVFLSTRWIQLQTEFKLKWQQIILLIKPKIKFQPNFLAVEAKGKSWCYLHYLIQRNVPKLFVIVTWTQPKEHSQSLFTLNLTWKMLLNSFCEGNLCLVVLGFELWALSLLAVYHLSHIWVIFASHSFWIGCCIYAPVDLDYHPPVFLSWLLVITSTHQHAQVFIGWDRFPQTFSLFSWERDVSISFPVNYYYRQEALYAHGKPF